MLRILLISTLCLLSLGARGNDSESEIEYLLTFVHHSGCDFVRNDNAHGSADAADHLLLLAPQHRAQDPADRRFDLQSALFVNDIDGPEPCGATCLNVSWAFLCHSL